MNKQFYYICHSNNYNLLACGSENNIIIYNIQTNQIINNICAIMGTVLCLNFSSDDLMLVSSTTDNNIRIWNTHNDKLLHVFVDSYSNISIINTAIFVPKKKCIVSGDSNGNIRIWDMENLTYNIMATHSGMVYNILYTQNNEYMISSHADGNIYIWKTKDYKLINIIKYDNDAIKSMNCSLDNKHIAYVSMDKTVKICDLNTFRLVLNIDENAIDITFSHDNKYIIIATLDNYIKIYDDKNKIIKVFDNKDKINSITCLLNNDIVMATSSGIKIWSVDNNISYTLCQ